MEEVSVSVKILKEEFEDQKSKKLSKKDKKNDDIDNYVTGLRWFFYLQYQFSCFFRSVKAVSICIALTVFALKLIYDPSAEAPLTISFNKFWNENSLGYVMSLLIPVIILYIGIPTCFHLLLLYYKWDTVMKFMLNTSFFYSICVTFGHFVVRIINTYKLPMDIIQMGLIIWNVAILGALAVGWKGSRFLKKAYLTILPALISILLVINIPLRLLWIVITVFSFWDIFAVLNRFGPLNLIVQQLEDRDDNILAGAGYPLDDDYDDEENDGKFETADEQINKTGAMLGLGDFLIYSLFVGIISVEESWCLTFISYFAVIIGMFITTMIMMAGNYHVYPALPVPVFCGMFAYYSFKALIWLI